MKDSSLTFIQIVSAIAVIFLHVNNCFWSFSTDWYWMSANIIECVFYFAVPVFFMITGITLLDYQDRYSTKIYFQKRIEKTLVPYIAWSIIGAVFLYATNRMTAEQFTVKWLINGILSTGGIISIYWFFQPLFCVYLAVPLFASIDKKKKKRILEYLIIAGCICNVIIPFVNYVLELGFSWNYKIVVASEYLLYVCGGYYVYHYPPAKKAKILIYGLAIAGLMAHLIGTYLLSMTAGSIQYLYKGYNNLPCLLYTLGIFLLLYDAGKWLCKNQKLCAAINWLGKYTFSAYLMHWFLLVSLKNIIHVDERNLIYRLITPFVIFAVSVVITWVIRKIPVIKRIVP